MTKMKVDLILLEVLVHCRFQNLPHQKIKRIRQEAGQNSVKNGVNFKINFKLIDLGEQFSTFPG